MTKNASRHVSFFRRSLPFLVLLIALATFLALGGHRYLSIGALIENRQRLNAFVTGHFALSLLAFSLFYIVATAVSIPGLAIMTLAGGFLFGWLLAGIVVVIAATIGASLLFALARTSIGEALTARAGPKLKRFSDGFRENAFSYLLFLRLVPIFPFWVVNLAPALFGVRFPVFLVTTALGILPGTFAFTVIGSGLDSVVAAQIAAQPDCAADPDCAPHVELNALLTPQLLAAFAALGLIALLPVAVKVLRRKAKQGARP